MHEVVLPASAFAVLSLLCAAVWAIAYSLGFFTSLQSSSRKASVSQAIGAYILFLLLQLLIMPFFLTIFKFEGSNPAIKGSIQILSIALAGLIIFSYTVWVKQAKRWFPRDQWILKLSFGAVTWFLAYPTILLFSQLAGFVVHEWLGYPLHEQLAVQQVINVKQYPVLLALMVVLMMSVVPLIEEILFRGFLQEALSLYMKPWGAIAGTSLVFACFHYSSSQGMNNIIIISSLYILSLILGYLKERQGSLWSPVALHAVFNGISLVQILFIE